MAALFEVAQGDVPGPVVVAGLAMGVVAIWILSSTGRISEADDVRAGVIFGILAGLGFGGLLIL